MNYDVRKHLFNRLCPYGLLPSLTTPYTYVLIFADIFLRPLPPSFRFLFASSPPSYRRVSTKYGYNKA